MVIQKFRFAKIDKMNNFIFFAEMEEKISIFDLKNNGFISELKTSFDSSDERFDISSDGLLIATSSWNKKNLCLYNTTKHELLWKNKNYNHLDAINISKGDNLLFLFKENSSFVFELYENKEIQKLKGVDRLWENQFNDFVVYSIKNQYIILKNNLEIYRIKKKSFSFLDVCMNDNTIFISEPGEQLKAYDIETGNLLWDFINPKYTHFIKLSFNLKNYQLFGILHNYKIKSNYQLVMINPINGIINFITNVEENCDLNFNKTGNSLVTTNGYFYDLDKIGIQTQESYKINIYNV